jgi:multicomponent K+:H+ antiporter subunit D
MNHWVVLPLILPPVMAAVMILAARHIIGLARVLSVATLVLLVLLSAGLLWHASGGEVTVYRLSNWPLPFGIVLVLDRLSALMLLLTMILALFVALYAIGSGWDARGKHFHALLMFQIMGIGGAFLTGDVFNLFVFFEVLLIASYGMMIHGGGERRLRAGVQYVTYNLLGSTLFLFALGTLYAVTGTLNMADLAQKVALLPPDDTVLIRIAAMLLLLVFAVKAALVPLHFWLPATYAEAPAPVAALFAIMTKVGAYAIIRVHVFIFGPDTSVIGDMAGQWLMPAAIVTLAIGMVGVLGARSLGHLAAYAAIGSMGTLLASVALFDQKGMVAALYYMIHSTLAGAVLFLVADMVRAGRAGEDRLIPAPALPQNGLVAALFFAAAIAMAGLPPLSGFVGKLLVLDATRSAPEVVLIWAAILGGSLVAVVGLARAGSVIFWNTTTETPCEGASATPGLALGAAGSLLALIVALTLLAGPVTDYLTATVAQLFDRAGNIAAILPAEAILAPVTTPQGTAP